MCLRPLPERRELRRRSPGGPEVFPMLSQHFGQRHSIDSNAVRIRAAFEQMQRIRVRVVVIRSHFRAIEQYGMAGEFGFGFGHRGIDVGAAIEEQIELRLLILWVITQVPDHENNRPAELIASLRISAGVEHAAQKGSISMHSVAHGE